MFDQLKRQLNGIDEVNRAISALPCVRKLEDKEDKGTAIEDDRSNWLEPTISIQTTTEIADYLIKIRQLDN